MIVEVRLFKIVHWNDDKSGVAGTKIDGFSSPLIIFHSRSELQVFALSECYVRVKFSLKATKKLSMSAIIASYESLPIRNRWWNEDGSFQEERRGLVVFDKMEIYDFRDRGRP